MSQETIQLQKKIKELEEELQIKKHLEFILDESINSLQQNERKRYVSDVALFYGSVFKKRLQEFIGAQMQDLVQIGRTELGTNIIRANINCFRLIDEWMEKVSNEHFGNLEEARKNFQGDKEFIKKLKENI